MKCIFLAAGYATRLYPLTKNFPKPLLEVRGKTILDWVIDDLEAAGTIDEYVVVTNHRFADHFRQWATRREPGRITVVDDATLDNEHRLGAVRDMALALEKGGMDDEVLVAAGDNLLDFSLWRLVEYGRAKGTSCVMRYHEPDEARLRKSGVLEIGDGDRVLSMQEKPAEPASHWCCPPFYYFTGKDAARVSEALAAGCKEDAPGSYISWLCQVAPVHAMEMPGRRHDIGNLESYERAQKEFRA